MTDITTALAKVRNALWLASQHNVSTTAALAALSTIERELASYQNRVASEGDAMTDITTAFETVRLGIDCCGDSRFLNETRPQHDDRLEHALAALSTIERELTSYQNRDYVIEKPMPERRKKRNRSMAEFCGHGTTIGSYPGEMYVLCDLGAGHTGDHRAFVSWACVYPDCEQATPKEPEE